jgi:hypothetical protein
MTNPIHQKILRALVTLSEVPPDVLFKRLPPSLSSLVVGPPQEALW